MLAQAHNLASEFQTPARIDFFEHELDVLYEKIGEIAGKRFHGSSFANFVYKHNVLDTDKMLSIPARVRPQLKDQVIVAPLPIIKKQVSVDGTVKFLMAVETPKGPQEIECVYIPDDERVTLCVSSQVGCKMGCKFCLTAQLGYKGSLSAGQIVRQVWTVDQQPDLRTVTNIVFMGMGEPFDNFDEVKKATRILTDHRGMEKSAKKITVSTVGFVDKIDRLKKEDPFLLAVSLNASNDDVRGRLMPINMKWDIKHLLESCHRYTKRTNKKVTFEYILMSGMSDRMEDAKRLVSLLSQLKCKINLIPYNESPFTAYKRPTDEHVRKFHTYLLEHKIPVFIRKNRGNDIFAACGMLKKVS
jgi:23S rRNA (adenine2503-C2)-methyltransferase